MPYLFTISIALSVLFSVLLLSIKKKKATHYLLTLFFLLVSFNAFYTLVSYLTGLSSYIPFFTELNYSSPILFGFILYLYTKSAILPSYSFSNKLPVIGVGYLFYFLSYSYVLTLNEVSYKIWLYLLFILRPIVYILVITRLLFFLKEIKSTTYWVEKNQHFKRWLLWLAIGGLVVSGLALIGYTLPYFYPSLSTAFGDYLIISFLGIYFFCLSIVAFRNTNLFQEGWMPKPISIPSNMEASTQVMEAERQLFQELTTFMETEKPFLNAQLSLHQLANQANLPVSKVSRLINQYGNTTFFDFVNRYRIKEVTNKMQNSQYAHLSLLGIALDSGFNSKTSFNRTFKKIMGKTPSAYRKELTIT